MADAMQQGAGAGGGAGANGKASRFTREELRALFSLNRATNCDTLDLLRGTPSGADWQVRPNLGICGDRCRDGGQK